MALTGNQREAAALALARGLTVKRAAVESAVGQRTLHRWLAEDPAFQRRVAELRQGLFAQVLGRLSDLSGQAADTLGELLGSQDHKVRLQAARTVLESASTYRQTVELSGRLAALEQQFQQRNDECAP
jgi:hypothetical protein